MWTFVALLAGLWIGASFGFFIGVLMAGIKDESELMP